jgi:parallel beta-helix repeat protein
MVLLVSMLVFQLSIQTAKAETIVVPDDYSAIQQAINNANEGDTIYVKAGTYFENIVLNRTVTLVGESNTRTIIDGGGQSEVVTISADGVVIANFTIQNGGDDDDGILLDECSNVIVSNNIVVFSQCGIANVLSSYNCLWRNDLSNNEVGIVLFYSYGNNVSGNTLVNNGLSVEESYGNIVEDNTVNGKPLVYLENVSHYTVADAGQVVLVECDDIHVENLNLSYTTMGLELWKTKNSRIVGNNITEIRPIYQSSFHYGIYLEQSSGNTIQDNRIEGCLDQSIGIGFRNSSYNVISGNNITDYGDGVWIASSSWRRRSSHNNVTGNSLTKNAVGICLFWFNCSHNIISENDIVANLIGIKLDLAIDNRISGNNIANNVAGIVFDNSSLDNSIYHNNFNDNTQQVHDYSSTDPSRFPSISIWDEGFPSGGNYWSDYVGTDVNGDGIGDTPYVIDSNNRDRYPLMKPWTPPSHESDFSITASPTSLTVAQGSSGSSTIAVTSLNGFEQLVFFQVSGVPSGIAPSLNLQFVVPPAGGSETSTLTVSISSTAMPGSYSVTVTGTSGTLVHDVTVSLQIKRPPVLLVHGFELISGYDSVHDPIWREIAEHLSGNDIGNAHLVTGHDFWKLEAKNSDYFTVYISNYTHDSQITSSPIRHYAHNLEEEIQNIKEDANVDKIYVVAHSMGGLVTRAYIENEDFEDNPYGTEYRNDISKLVMLGTPNNGVDLAEISAFINSLDVEAGPLLASMVTAVKNFLGTDSARDMAPDSDFLGNLTLGNTIDDQGNDYGVEYSAIAGNFVDMREYAGPLLWSIIKVELLFPYGDGAVSVSSALYGVPHDRTFKLDLTHTELCTSSLSKEKVWEFLSTVSEGDFFVSRYCSPGELRVCDSQGRITGLVNGQIVEEIPNSEYDEENEMVIIHPAIDSYRCEVVGKSDGDYGLDIALVKVGETIIFAANDIPIRPEEVHQYIIDWAVLSQGGEGVTVEVDSDGNGVAEQIFTSDGKLTPSEFVPEFPSILFIVLFMMATLLALIVHRRKSVLQS